MDKRTRYSLGVRERTVRLVQEHAHEYGSQWTAIRWVERFSFDAEPAKVDVFDVAGNYLGTLVGASLPVGFLPRGQLLTAPVDASHGGRMLVIQRLAPSPWQ